MSLSEPTHRLSLDTARALAVNKQGLARRPDATDKGTLLEIIRRIGLLQLDSIHVVSRSHYLVMLSRAGLYDPGDLDALLYPDRQVFEQWAHAACLIPIEHFKYFAPLIFDTRQLHTKRLKWLGPLAQEVLDDVLKRVADEGPLRSVDFQDTRDKAGTWWDWKPAKIALEILFEQGHLMIDRRVNFQRYYDLAERVLPGSEEPPSLTVDDWRRWATRESIGYLGVGTIPHIADYHRQLKSQMIPVLEALVGEGVAVPVEVEGWKETAYVLAEDLSLVHEIEDGLHSPGVTALLSPFDNLVWHRNRVRDLFGFDYRLEVYAPAATKGRKWGYYVVPILHNGRLVGRIDPKANRRDKALLLHAVYLEPGELITDGLIADLGRTLREFAEFHACHTVHIENCDPSGLKEALLRACG